MPQQGAAARLRGARVATQQDHSDSVGFPDSAGPPDSAGLRWVCAERVFTPASRPLLMGILNVTPDSFSDGGRFHSADEAIAQALVLADAGADIIDVGGESSRPGAEPVALEEELARVVPVVAGLRGRCQAAVSVDTTKAAVARAALAAGASIVNDISACTADPDMVEIVKASGAGVVLMHMQGTPRTMQVAPRYDDVVAEVRTYLADRARALLAAGVGAAHIAVDPGIGFGKTPTHNLQLLAQLEALVALGYPVAVGLSRKRLLGTLTGRPVEARLAGGLAGLAWCVAHGAGIMRVHDVAAARDALLVTRALMDPEAGIQGD